MGLELILVNWTPKCGFLTTSPNYLWGCRLPPHAGNRTWCWASVVWVNWPTSSQSPLPQGSLWAVPSSTSMETAQRKWSVPHDWLLNTSASSGRMWLLICYATGSGATMSWMSPSSPTQWCTKSSGRIINLHLIRSLSHSAHIVIFTRHFQVGWPTFLVCPGHEIFSAKTGTALGRLGRSPCGYQEISP